MSVSSLPLSPSSLRPSLEYLPAFSLRWRALEPLSVFCELTATDRSLLDAARRVFDVTEEAPPPYPGPVVLRRHIDVGLRVHNPQTGEVKQAQDREHALRMVEYGFVEELVKAVALETGGQALDTFAMHGALLFKDGVGIVVFGPKQAGKSTLSFALWKAGWSLLSDDFCFLDARRQALPVPRRVSLRQGSRDLLGEAIWQQVTTSPSSGKTDEGWLFHPHELQSDARLHRGPVDIGAFVFLGPGEPAPAQKLNPAVAAFTLLPYCTLLARPDSINEAPRTEWSAALPRIAPVAGDIPVFTLTRAPLAQMVASIEEVGNQL